MIFFLLFFPKQQNKNIKKKSDHTITYGSLTTSVALSDQAGSSDSKMNTNQVRNASFPMMVPQYLRNLLLLKLQRKKGKSLYFLCHVPLSPLEEWPGQGRQGGANQDWLRHLSGTSSHDAGLQSGMLSEASSSGYGWQRLANFGLAMRCLQTQQFTTCTLFFGGVHGMKAAMSGGFHKVHPDRKSSFGVRWS